MAFIIDGYNVLNASRVFGPAGSAHVLQRSREALLEFLARHLGPDQSAKTVVVFDAKGAPPGLPRTIEHRGIEVRYAASYAEADDLIEELIRRDSAPRQLTVVSSDHRLQRAARRRRATAVDSEIWLAQLVRSNDPAAKGHSVHGAPDSLTEEEVAEWVEQFGTGEAVDLDRELMQAMLAAAANARALDADAVPAREEDDHRKPSALRPEKDIGDELPEDLADPFPPGYAEDLLEDEDI
jgi:predicted RNA-binding protein with PIN domain